MQRSKQRSGKSSKPTYLNSRDSSRSATAHESLVGGRGFSKRLIDIMGSSLGLIVLSPLLTVIACFVTFSDGGAVLYRQRRVGLHGRRFTILKFRTMGEDAEKGLGAVWSVPRDPRCTRLGGYLRRFALDELPQLWNVLKGDMSLVGPRPERPEFTREFRREHAGYEVRHSVRPGISGFAQVYGWRGYTSIEERLRHDLFYITHWSMVLDVRIILLTFVRVWSEKTRNGV